MLSFFETVKVLVFRFLDKPIAETNDVSQELFAKLNSVFSNPVVWIIFGAVVLIAFLVILTGINK